ncbi:MAG: LacI family DNA-binding transcriptional regulator [Kiritimatiellae bacterium]|nr:LacI family DNA-binding transcriptional regulator [Kiritimatiellia bacterium]
MKKECKVRSATTLYDVARRAGVSHTTVSSVLNRPDQLHRVAPATVERVRQAAAALNYRPHQLARNLALGRTNTVVLTTQSTLRSASVHDVIWSVQRVLSDRGYHLIVDLTHRVKDEAAVYDSIMAGRCDGLICAGASPVALAKLPMIKRAGIPVVALSGTAGVGIDTVSPDGAESFRMALEHLWSLGRERVALVQAAWPNMTARPGQDLYRDCHLCADRPYDPALVLDYMTPDDPAIAWRKLRDLADPPTALIVHSDHLASRLIRCIHADGLKVPRDVAIVATDSSMWSDAIETPLTTVAVDSDELGQALVECLIARMRDPDAPPRDISMRPRLTARASTVLAEVV